MARKHDLRPDVVLENFQTALALEGGVGLLNLHAAVSLEAAVVEIRHQHDAFVLTRLPGRKRLTLYFDAAGLR